MENPPIVWKNLAATALESDAALRGEWNRLNAARADLPFLDAGAVVAALRAFGSGKERLLAGGRGGRCQAMLLLVPSGKFGWQTFQPSQIPLGAWVAEAGLMLEDLAAELLRGPLRPSLVLSITQIDPHHAPRRPDGTRHRTDDYVETGWVDIAGSFADYWQGRGKNLRQNLRKQRNKLAGDGIAAQVRKITEPAAMADAIARYGAIESAGWKAEQGTAIHAGNPQGGFYRELLAEAATRGEAVVYEFLFDERPVASNLCLARGDTITILKTTYDEATHPFSPAFLLLQDELEAMHAESRFRRLEFYGRMMEWHGRWTEQKRRLYHLTCFRWPFLKRIAALRKSAAKPLEG